MDVGSLIVFLIVGGVAGWLAGLIVKGFGFGLVGNIIVGIVGAFLAGWLLPRLGFISVATLSEPSSTQPSARSSCSC